MRCRHWMLLLVFLAVGLVGCQGSTGPGENPAPANAEAQRADGCTQMGGELPRGESEHADPNDTSKPAAAVSVFLDALRRGDDKKILDMYTVRAREQASQLNEHFAPRGSDTAQFQVGQVEHLPHGVARVASTWTDLDQDGQRHTLEFFWRLRREPDGWRVAGMEATPFPGELPLLLDFENLEETIRKVNLLAEEIQRRAEKEVTIQAQQTEIPEDSLRR